MKFQYLELFSEKIDFLSILVHVHWKSAFWGRPCLKTSLWRHTLTDFHDFGINGNGTKQSYFGPVNFKFIRGVITTSLVNHVTKKGLVGRGLNCKTTWFDPTKCFESDHTNKQKQHAQTRLCCAVIAEYNAYLTHSLPDTKYIRSPASFDLSQIWSL